jgi:glycosyltransferase involved in cell wall biosynthesis
MIVKNEEHSLERCLSSVEGCVDEIVVVDTGSDDNTVEIAKRFGAAVFYRPWDNDFAAARNFSISKATGDWIFYLDADEELEPNCSTRFRALTDDPDAHGFLFQITNLTDSKDSMRHINLRLFKNLPGYRFKGRLHEQIMDAIIKTSGGKAPILKSGINIFHYGYLTSEFTAKNKAERNFKINKMMVEEEPDNPFYLYTLGNSLVNLNDIENAASNYQKALQFLNPKEQYAPSVFAALIACLVKLGRLDEAVEQVQRCKSFYPDYVDIHYIEGEIYTKLGHLERGRLSFEECLRLGEQAHGKYTTRTGVGSFLPLFGLAEIYAARGDLNKAINYQSQGLKIKNNDIREFVTLAGLLKKAFKDGYKVLELLSNAIKNPDKADEKLILARLLYEIEEYDLSLTVLDELPLKISEVYYLKGLALIKKSRYNEAIEFLKRIDKDASTYQTALPELVQTHWLPTPPLDAGLYIQKVENRELARVLQSINDRLLGRQSEPNPPVESDFFKQIINKLLSLKQTGPVLNILTACGLEAPNDKIAYLATAPATNDKLELAAKIALQELKKGVDFPDYYFVLARYFCVNDELDTARSVLQQALAANPEAPRYRRLLREIYRRQTLRFVLAALEKYPDNRALNKCLFDLQKDAFKESSLKGVH